MWYNGITMKVIDSSERFKIIAFDNPTQRRVWASRFLRSKSWASITAFSDVQGPALMLCGLPNGVHGPIKATVAVAW